MVSETCLDGGACNPLFTWLPVSFLIFFDAVLQRLRRESSTSHPTPQRVFASRGEFYVLKVEHGEEM